MNFKEKFGAKVKELRKSKKFTQEYLAELINISPRQLIRIENGENLPSSETVEKICKALDTDDYKLFNFSSDNENIKFISGSYNKPNVKVVIDGEKAQIKPIGSFSIEPEAVKANKYENRLIELSKTTKTPITAEIFEKRKPIEVKTFHTNGTVEIVLSSEDIRKNEIYSDVLKKINYVANDENKLYFIKTAIDALEDKKSLEKVKSIIRGIELNS